MSLSHPNILPLRYESLLNQTGPSDCITSPVPKRLAGQTGRDLPDYGWFAVVCSIPDPQKSCLDALKEKISVKQEAPVHITILPPRPLRVSVDLVCERVRRLVSACSVFTAELTDIRLFAETGFLYLDVARGKNTVSEMHELLNTGDLAYAEPYEFQPHLTLGGPLPPEQIDAARSRLARQWKAADCPRELLVEELVCLWIDPRDENQDWRRHQSFSLKPMSRRMAG